MLDRLPSEIGWRVLAFVEPEDIAATGATCHTLNELASANDVWRPRLRSLFRTHSRTSAAADELDGYSDDRERAWLDAWTLIGAYRQRLGWWASSQAGGKLIRVCTLLHPASEDATLLSRMSIRAERVEARNGYEDEEAMSNLPRRPQASFWDQASSSYIMLPNHHGPDAGLSVDLLQVKYHYTRVAAAGAEYRLYRTPLDLVLMPEVTVPTESSSSDARPRVIFPSRSLHLSGALVDSVIGPDGLRCQRALRLEARLSTAVAESRPGISQPRQPNANVVYQPPSAVDAVLQSMDAELEQTDTYYANFLQQLVQAPGSLIHLERDARTTRPPRGSNLCVPSLVPAALNGQDILVKSLVGLWVGSYSAHGLEFGHVSVRPIEDAIAEPDGIMRSGGLAIEYCKVTGDRNVPAGEISWSSALPLHDPRATVDTAILPTVTNEQLLDWSDAPAGSLLASQADWSKGTAPARGRGAQRSVTALRSTVALSGFVQPSWTNATTVFIRDSDSNTCSEIRLRWPELRKVSVFRRVLQ